MQIILHIIYYVMRKCWVVVLVLLLSVVSAGCNGAPKKETMAHPWPVIIVLKYQLQGDTVPAGSVDAMTEYLKDVETIISVKDKVLQIELWFEEHNEFLKFFDVTDTPVNYEQREHLFTWERTFKFANPVTLVKGTPALGGIEDEVKKLFTLDAAEEVEYVYVFCTGFRRSRVTGHYNYENLIIVHYYYFRDDVETIQIHDKFANTPIWYVLGVVGTAVFMVALYLILRNKKDKIPHGDSNIL